MRLLSLPFFSYTAPLVILTTFGLTAANPGSATADETDAIMPQIVGGKESQPNAWPWAAALLDGNGAQSCTGSLIHPQWVLTAAHCFLEGESPNEQINLRSLVDVVLGTVDYEVGGELIAIESVTIHPAYNKDTNDSDIALVRLSQASTQTPVELAKPFGLTETPGNLATAIGWGGINPVLIGEQPAPEDFQNLLREVELPLISNADCNQALGGGITNNMLCAGDGQGGRDTCQGDSGGPLMVREGVEWKEVGVTSFGAGCAQPGQFGVYALVSNFQEFVTSTICSDAEIPQAAPALTVGVVGNTLELSWTAVAPSSTGYQLYLVLLPAGTILSVDLNQATSLPPLNVPSGIEGLFAVVPYNGACSTFGRISNVEQFSIP